MAENPAPRMKVGSWRSVAALSMGVGCFLVPSITAGPGPWEPPKVLVDQGNAQEADAYYLSITGQLGPNWPPTTLDKLFGQFGYTKTAAQFEADPPSALMQDPDVLATRFFAPKISDPGDPIVPTSAQYGWRKLVRLKAKAGSGAALAGLDKAWILFNWIDADLSKDPFRTKDTLTSALRTSAEGRVFLPRHSLNNQVILTRAAVPVKKKDTGYFLDYQSLAAGGNLGKFLTATFDASTGSPTKQYFVPKACMACHGGADPAWASSPPPPLHPRPALNYLDTDNWYDRARPGDDFQAVTAKWPVLFDGGLAGNTTQSASDPVYSAAFNTVRLLNAEIRSQAGQVAPGSIQWRAADQWIGQHQANLTYLGLFQRAWPPTTSTAKWTASDPTDGQLLPLLNRYCSRCHSSLKFHVYDKDRLLVIKNLAKSYVNSGLMPQDRQLPANLKSQLVNLLQQVH